MQYKLLAIDLDNTLLNSNREIDNYSLNVINAAKRKGIIVIIATGRMIRSVRPYLELLDLNTPCISFAGARVCLPGGEVLYETPLPSETAHELALYCRKKDIHLHFYTSDNYFYFNDNEMSRGYAKLQTFSGIADEEYMLNPDIVTPKALIIANPENITSLQQELREHFSGLSVVRSHDRYLDITDKKASKGSALKFVLDYYNIDKSEVIAFGDNEIDIDMLRLAGLGVCVENAESEVKLVAGFITRSNNDFGVALAIEKFVLEGTA